MKQRHLARALPAAFASLLLLVLAPVASAQHLQAGRVIDATTSDEDVTAFTFQAESAGVLTVVVRSTDEKDLVLTVTDADGQPLPDARSGASRRSRRLSQHGQSPPTGAADSQGLHR